MRRVFIIALLLPAVVGCGTVENLTGGGPKATRPYGGTQIAVNRFGEAHDAELAMKLPLWLADVPLCLVGDTLTLPLALAVQSASSLGTYYFPTKGRGGEEIDPHPKK